MRILLGHHGLRGDLAINLPAIEHLRRIYESKLLIDMPIHRQFADMLPLFANHPALNACVVTDDYEHFPSDKDRAMLAARGYEQVFNPMQPHREDDFWRRRHQTSAVLHDYFGVELPESEQQINLVKWFDVEPQPNCIAFAPFAGNYNPDNTKALSFGRAQEIVDLLYSMGYTIIQLGGPNEPSLERTWNAKVGYFEAVRLMLGCRALIHADTGLGWVCSGYKHPQLGLYSHAYYGKEHVKNIQPRNSNALYLAEENVNEITLDEVTKSLTILLA